MKNFLQVSTKGHYGLMLMAYLAKNFDSDKCFSLKEIGESENISAGYLEEIAAMLKREKLIKSQRGKSGGYMLSKDPMRINILDIVESLEGPLMLVDCLGGGVICSNKKCTSRGIWQKVQRIIYQNLKDVKLGEFINR